ncbi:hypothetical protein [Algoriphagus aquimarinus]|uniref:Uncharacterized protein n=1 Tax=Algoriphagus aquimarinus TaxID=237018 RepID=A0A1I0ZQR8_9BACT|nr:hypothetical protein [Algoriphagus aquimarinus]SFB28005.1 hypothetical protein SAMN04489723_106252 [Algoriphagus aquimarinus]
MQPDNNQENTKTNSKLTPELYDKFAPPVYGKILSIVHQGPIAGKVLEKVFVSAYTKDETFPLRSPLMSLIDLAQERSRKTVKALTIFRECCSGASISITDKK